MPVGSFKCFVEQKLGKFPHFLIYAFLEWVMIILLFVDGFLAFVSNEFAKYFELRIPCLLCTRIDHLLAHRNSNFYYNDSICEHHKKEISSLAYCHVHKKLSDLRTMCEGCLLSFATEKDSDCDKYKSLIGILHKDIDCFVEDNQKLLMNLGNGDDGKEISDEKSGAHLCSCCGEALKPRASAKYGRSLSMNAPTPSPRAPLLARRNEEGRSILLPHVKYTELKFMSDAEQELSEYEDAPNGENQGRDDVKSASVPLLPDSEEMTDDSCRTPSFARGTRFFGIPLSDSAQASPRWGYKIGRKLANIDCAPEPNDANSFNELDGDILNRLKRQVRLDRKSLIALYMELDEERSASAVAANNAMAMITRLQAEKAAVQMEALQYQRMMEEQAEYDQEALQVMKDMLLKREEDIKALESELDTYREKYGLIKKVGSDICEIDADEDYQDMKSQSLSSYGERSECGSSNGADRNENERPNNSMEDGEGSPNESSLDFEGERSYLLGLLVDLERKINSPSDEVSNSSEGVAISNEDGSKGKEQKGSLKREVSLIRERLRTIEADSGFLKHAAMTLQRGGEGTKLLTEIAQHLRQIRDSNKSITEDSEA
ncbi:probable myosin-binding protein 5 [Henckelia pumila]|uniref:probable myosin-binding protein 5 n=1 Tax=Henckelia pumila TaxID=405737 RepID=UPI003C6E7DAC